MAKTKKKNVYAGVGISKADDPFKAGAEAVQMAISKMQEQGGKKPTFGLVFCSGGKYGKNDKTIQALVDGAHSVFGDTPWIGCTTAGEISSYGATNNSVVAMVISSDYIHVGIGIGENFSKKPKEASFKAANTAWKLVHTEEYVDAYLQYLRTKQRSPSELIRMNPFSMIVLGKGPEKGILPIKPVLPDNEKILDGIIEAIGDQASIIGGAAADDWHIRKNYHFVNGEVYKDTVVVAALMNHVYSSAGIEHGYKPTKKFALVNEVKDDHLVTKMNGKPAVNAYSELTGVPVEKIKKNTLDVCVNYPLGVADPSGNYWLRVPGMAVFNSLFLSPKISPGTVLHIMSGDKKHVLDACKNATYDALRVIGKKKIAFALVFSCALRAKLLGREINKEIEILKRSIGDVPIIGFYTFGEIGGTKGRRMGFHNQTVTVLVVSEDIMV